MCPVSPFNESLLGTKGKAQLYISDSTCWIFSRSPSSTSSIKSLSFRVIHVFSQPYCGLAPVTLLTFQGANDPKFTSPGKVTRAHVATRQTYDARVCIGRCKVGWSLVKGPPDMKKGCDSVWDGGSLYTLPREGRTEQLPSPDWSFILESLTDG